MTLFETFDRPQPTRPGAALELRDCKTWSGAKYYVSLPQTAAPQGRVLVTVHGISRNARRHVQAFASGCNDLGWAVIAPLFPESRFPGYQRLGFDRKRAHPRPDVALNHILDEFALETGLRTDRVYMFGHSGGGQFVQRYILVNPQRVIAAALGAPGWYTFPDAAAPFPRGLQLGPDRGDYRLDWAGALEVPTAVFVGAKDNRRDDTLKTSPKVDRQQGRTRSERGRAWVEAMDASARAHGLDTCYAFSRLEGCGHSFSKCISIGRMDAHVLDFLIRASPRETTVGAGPKECRAAANSALS